MSLEKIQKAGLDSVEQAESLSVLEEIRVRFFGKQGEITLLTKEIAAQPPEERKAFGQQVHGVRSAVLDAWEGKKALLEQRALSEKLAKESVDITLPPRSLRRGSVHPISRVIEEAVVIFEEMGFAVEFGPEIEDDFHNFTALNIPDHHPARQMQDTFYLDAKDDQGKPYVLRTHTSSVQIRAMEGAKPPFKLIAPGRVYRSDYDATHTPMFHQIEGLYIDKAITMGHLKACLQSFLQRFFALEEVPLRFRPSYFPFTEPSAEVDIGCIKEQGNITIGKGDDWLEILGCGMVHPNVLKNVGVDPDEYQGFAFGLGIERLAMLKYGAPDLRDFFGQDIRWLNHYGFSAFG